METQQNTLEELLQFGLSDRLQKSLTVADISVQDMADTLEVSRNTVGNYLHGNTQPKRLYLREWAFKTGVPLEWLETGHFPDAGAPETEKAPTPKGGGDGATYQNRTGDLFITSETLAPIIPISAAA